MKIRSLHGGRIVIDLPACINVGRLIIPETLRVIRDDVTLPQRALDALQHSEGGPGSPYSGVRDDAQGFAMTYTRVMIGSFNINGRPIRVDFSRGESLAIPLDPHGEQPSFFVSDKATAEPLREGDYIGSIRAGGSCNAEAIRFVPHSHGTHTECIGHILETADPVQQRIDSQPGLVRVISVSGNAAGHSDEDYHQPVKKLICRDEIRDQLGPGKLDEYRGLVIRSLPNDSGKTTRNYSGQPNYPVLSAQAIDWLAASSLLHLLIDMPSLDKADDGGKLANHRAWWGLNDSVVVNPHFAACRSVTEMIFVPGHVEDGDYWLELQLSPIMSDACASRPVIYPLVEQNV